MAENLTPKKYIDDSNMKQILTAVKNEIAVGAVGDKYFSNAPIGVIQAFSGQTIPHGYLLANGASYPTADYPDLYAVIGNTYGGDTENFNVPNLVDKFIQGSTTSGTEKEAGLPNITGGWMPSVPVGYENYVTGAVTNEIKSSGLVSSSGTQLAIGAGFKIDASKSSAVYGKSDTVQPPSLTMVYIIKAFHTNEGVDSGVSDDVINYVNNLNSYSTEEHLTGGKWVDGKPVYEKTVFSSFTNYTVGEYTLFSIPLDNINVIISIEGMVNYDSKFPVPVNYNYENSSGNKQRIATYYSRSKGTIETFVYSSSTADYVNANYFVTIRYTKTTD